MAKITLLLTFLFLNLFSSSFGAMPAPQDQSYLVIKSMLTKKPNDVDAQLAIAIGSMYQHGYEDLSVQKNIDKAIIYYQSAADRNVTMGNILLANIAFSKGDIDTYKKNMSIAMYADDKELSVVAGLQLATVLLDANRKEESMEVLQYLADNYNEPRSQFMLGWAVVFENYTSDSLSIKDGEFYLYRACNNPSRTKSIEKQCTIHNIKR